MKKSVVVSIAIILALIIAAFTVYILLKSSYNTSENTNNSINQNLSVNNPVNENPINNTPVNSNSKTYIIDIEDRMYDQNIITIKVGDRITWSNKDSTGHTVTSDEGIELSSSKLSEGDTYSHTFDKAGTYPYHCIYHSSMHGTVIVQ